MHYVLSQSPLKAIGATTSHQQQFLQSPALTNIITISVYSSPIGICQIAATAGIYSGTFYIQNSMKQLILQHKQSAIWQLHPACMIMIKNMRGESFNIHNMPYGGRMIDAANKSTLVTPGFAAVYQVWISSRGMLAVCPCEEVSLQLMRLF